MQAILVKYIGPRNNRGSRVKARSQAGSVTVEYDDRLNAAKNKRAAAKLLCERLSLKGTWVSAYLPNGDCVFVMVDHPCRDQEDSFTL